MMINFYRKQLILMLTFQISSKNGLSNLVCDYCYNLIQQFYEYFEKVNANQNELMKMVDPVVKEEVFAFPFEETSVVNMKIDEDDDETEWFDNEDPINSPSSKSLEPKIIISSSKTIKKAKKTPQIKLSKKDVSALNFFELNKLPFNFTCSYRCSLCPPALPKNEPNKFKTKPLLKTHILSTHSMDQEQAKSHLKNLHPQCDICNKSIKVRQDHKFVHYNIKPYKCALCNHSAHTKEILRCHLLKHENQVRKQGCFYCPKDFPSSFLRNQHISESHPNNIITCDLCGEILYGKKFAKVHFREHRNRSMLFECERCVGGVRFPNKEVLALHRNQHKREDQSRKKLACSFCERKFNNGNALQVHLRLHANGRIIPCDICGKSVGSDLNQKIKEHIKTHLVKQKSHKCDICEANFPSRQFLFHHHRKMHDPKEQSCYRCGKMLPEYFMKLHLFYCKGDVDIRCFHCPMLFKKESERLSHTQLFHLGFNCRRCNMQFQNKSQLKKHQKRDETHLRTIKKRPNAAKKSSQLAGTF